MISIIIIVKNDREIENTLNSLKQVKKPEKTEIIVIDASKKEVLLDIKKKFPKVRWFYYENKTGKRYTYSEQRNFGIKKSKGGIIVFIDADCIPIKNWLINITKPIINGKEKIVAGMIKSTSKDYATSIKKLKYLNEYPTMNLAFDKKILKKEDYFDESLEAGEDLDFTWRLVNKGYAILYVCDAIIYHDEGDLKHEIKRAIRYGEARVNLYSKHEDRLKYLLKPSKDLFSLYSVTFFFYIISLIPLTFFWHYYPLFLIIPLIKNIKNNPLRKMTFDFFWGYGVIKRFFEIILHNHETTKTKKTK